MSAAVAEVTGLTVEFGSVRAVEGLDLTVRPGAGVALVGRNGAGKSTTLRALAGVLPPRGRLPFEVPRSADAVRASRADVANDTEDPLYPVGAGLGS